MEFRVNYGMEAPHYRREFCQPPMAAGTVGDFTWMVDSNYIVWMNYRDPSLMESPSLNHCLSVISEKDPDALVTVLQLLEGMY